MQDPPTYAGAFHDLWVALGALSGTIAQLWWVWLLAGLFLWVIFYPSRVAFRRRDAAPWALVIVLNLLISWTPILGLLVGWTIPIFGWLGCLWLAKSGQSKTDPSPDFVPVGWHRDRQTNELSFVGPYSPPSDIGPVKAYRNR